MTKANKIFLIILSVIIIIIALLCAAFIQYDNITSTT